MPEMLKDKLSQWAKRENATHSPSSCIASSTGTTGAETGYEKVSDTAHAAGVTIKSDPDAGLGATLSSHSAGIVSELRPGAPGSFKNGSNAEHTEAGDGALPGIPSMAWVKPESLKLETDDEQSLWDIPVAPELDLVRGVPLGPYHTIEGIDTGSVRSATWPCQVMRDRLFSISTRDGELFLLRQKEGDESSEVDVSATLVYKWSGKFPNVKPLQMREDLTSVTIKKEGAKRDFCFMDENGHDECV